jgi:hypothetical protein
MGSNEQPSPAVQESVRTPLLSTEIMFKRLLLFYCFQESCTDHCIDDTGDERAEADI